MASEAKPPILAAPLEIRHEIYRYAWTVAFEEKLEVLGRRRTDEYSETTFFKFQVKRLYKLISICQQLIYEVFSEYFRKTHVWLEENLAPTSAIPADYATRHMQSSALFTFYTQHVRLVIYGPAANITEIVDWLLKLKHLKTLKLEIFEWRLDDDDLSQAEFRSIINEYPGPGPVQRLATLRNLEKVEVKFRGPENGHLKRNIELAGGAPEFQRFMDNMSEMVREVGEDLRQSEQQPTYKFEHSIGSFS